MNYSQIEIYQLENGKTEINVQLDKKSVVAKNATTASDRKVYQVDYYNLLKLDKYQLKL